MQELVSQFDVEEINKCLDISGYIGIFYSKLLQQNNKNEGMENGNRT